MLGRRVNATSTLLPPPFVCQDDLAVRHQAAPPIDSARSAGPNDVLIQNLNIYQLACVKLQRQPDLQLDEGQLLRVLPSPSDEGFSSERLASAS